MKKHLLLATATVAMLASCTSEVIPERPTEVVPSPIHFSGAPAKMTRAQIEGSAAATILGNKFVVYGAKDGGDTRDEGLFMPGYIVDYVNGQWEYSHRENQSIKYWDLTATSYTFAAYSNQNRDNDNAEVENPAVVGPQNATDNFTIPAVTADQLGKIHFTPKKAVSNTGYENDVNLDFSNAAAKIRVAFYNTIPGYDIDIIGFYESSSATSVGDNVVFFGEADNQFVTTAGYTVAPSVPTTDNIGIAYTMATEGKVTASTLTLGDGVVKSTDNIIGGPNIKFATFDKAEKAWTFVHPQPNNDKQLRLKVKYRMYAEGDVHAPENHEVIIPAVYAQWKPNHAYTYYFKITDSDLHPIVFNAIVEDFHNEETITTVDPSNEIDITTYLEGSDVSTHDQYFVNDAVKVTITYPTEKYDIETTVGHHEVTDFEAETHITESNCEKLITNWTPLDGNLSLSHPGYYAIRVKWTKKNPADGDTNTTGFAYKVITVHPIPASSPDPTDE